MDAQADLSIRTTDLQTNFNRVDYLTRSWLMEHLD